MDRPAATDATTEPRPAVASEPPHWVTVSRNTRAAEGPVPELSPRRVVVRLVAGVLAVVLAVGLLGSLAAQRLAERESVNDAATTADVLADAVVTPALTDGLAEGEAAAVREFDSVVRARVLGPRIVRVKLWAPDGRVVYADEPQLVGRVFDLSAEQLRALAEPRTQAEVSDLSASENEFETGERLLEVYRPVWTPSGAELLFEIYLPYEPVSQRAGELWRGFAGVTVSSLLLLVVLTAPILWGLLRRVGAAQRVREQGLERALEASETERRRVAAALHDGPVQGLVAASFAAEGAAARAGSGGQTVLAGELRGIAGTMRATIRALRTLLVDIYPPSLTEAGLAAALADLADGTRSEQVEVHLDLESGDVGLSPAEERLVFRVAQECLRNVRAHAAPCTATVRLTRDDAAVVLDVIDDGAGFDTAAVARGTHGHFGLRVLADLATEAGAVLQVASAPGRGTHWRLVLARTGGPSGSGSASGMASADVEGEVAG